MPGSVEAFRWKRFFIFGAIGVVGWAVTLLPCTLFPAAADERGGKPRSENLIEKENRRPGSLDWQLTRVRLDKTTGFRSPFIEGYCSHQSVQAGDTLRIMVSTTPAARFKIEVFRTGYYGGRGARLLNPLGPLQGKAEPVPPVGPRRDRA